MVARTKDRSKSVVDNPKDRDDCKVVKVPTSSVGFLTGYRGESLRAIERESSTFMFTDGDGRGNGESENLLIFSFSRGARDHAADIVEDRIRHHKQIGRGGGGPGGGYNDGPRGYGGPPGGLAEVAMAVRREARRWATVEVTAGRGARRWVVAMEVAMEVAAATTAATARAAAAAATAAAGRAAATASARRAAAATTRTRRARARARAAAAAAATRRRRPPRADLIPPPSARTAPPPLQQRFLSLFTRRDRPLSTSVSGGTLRRHRPQLSWRSSGPSRRGVWCSGGGIHARTRHGRPGRTGSRAGARACVAGRRRRLRRTRFVPYGRAATDAAQ